MIIYKNLGKNGRLGNQFFQISSTIGLAKKNNQLFSFPEWEYSKYINISQEWFSNNNNGEDLGLLFYQDFNNFLHIENEIKNLLKPSNLIINEINDLKNKWLSDSNIEYIMIGIRRTDYLAAPNFYPIPTLEYYKNGINFIKEKRSNKILKTICFSDDIEWCKNNIETDYYYSDNHSIDIVKLFLISKCHHFIIANSTFYWWSAYLSNVNEEKIVIYPIKWLGIDVPDKHTFNLFYPEWYGFNNFKPINFPNKLNINILDAINKEDF